MKFNPLNSLFKEGETILKVKEAQETSCKGCYYNEWKGKHRLYPYGCCVHGHVCTPYYRKDKKFVIFVRISQ
jgi:hypothetical protein